jgi:hypothetical protein
VQHAVEDFETEVQARSGRRLPAYHDLGAALVSDHNPLLLFGEGMRGQLASRGVIVKTNDLVADGFLIRDIHLPKSTKRIVLITGSDPHGTMYGALEMLRILSIGSPRGNLQAPLDLQENPSFSLRGVYAHTAWVYNYPFALRRWKLDDWKRYIDLLAALKVNLLQIWTPVSITPVPLSDEDRRYLAMFDQVTRYAKEERGFREVWLGDAANNVALATKKAVADREYYVVHSLRNPGNPKEFKDIVASRTALYRTDPHADGYWVIDSDPGNWPGSPSHEFAEILAMNRGLINEFTSHGADAKLIYWIWQGWGTGSKAQNVEDVLKEIEPRIKGRTEFLICFPNDLPIVHKFGLLEESVWFPYGAVEGEPSSPYTALRFKQIEASLEAIKSYPALRGVMANAQTPLVQIPNLWLFERKAWNATYSPADSHSILLGAAEEIFPSLSSEIAEGWQMLSLQDAKGSRAAVQKLEDSVRRRTMGRPGPVGRYVIPDGTWLVENLASQLRVHADAVDFVNRLEGSGGSEPVLAAAQSYLESAMEMESTTGFRPAINKQGKNLLPFFNWFYANEDYARVRSVWSSYKTANPDSATTTYNQLHARCQNWSQHPDCKVMVEFLVGEPPKRSPDFHYAN